MKKNYFKFHIKASSIVEVSKTYYLLLIFLSCILFSSNANAQVTITKPNLSITSCSGFPSAYSPLGDIIITETVNSNFTPGTGITLVLSAPANFEFLINTGTVTVDTSNTNLSSPSITVTTSTITITYTCIGTNKIDTMTISGLQVRAITSASTGDISRTAGTGVINGLINGTTLGSLTSINTTPTITTQPTATSVCANSTTTFNVVATGAATYQWRKNGVNLTNIAPYSGVTTATLTITNPNISENLASFDVVISSSTPCFTTSAAAILTVNPTLPASISIAASANPICDGTSVTFTATPTNGGTTPSYQWKLNGTDVGSNVATYTNAALANGDIVTCELTSNASPCLTGSPATSNAITMTVNPNLPASISISESVNTICDGTSVTFTATPVNGGTSPTYQWKLNGANVGSNAATYTNTTLANGDVVTCELTSNAICATGNPALSNEVTMIVNPILPASISILESVNTICDGTSVTFTATPTNGGTTPAYQWKLNGTDVGSNAATYTNDALANGDIVTCVLTSNATPCLTGSPAISNAITMTVNPNLPASVNISASANPICAGTSVTFSATPTNGGLNPSYQWKLNGTNVGANAATYTDAGLANGDIVTCELTSNATPCLTGSPATSNSISMTVNPFPVSAGPISGASSVCQGESSVAYSVPVIANATSYTWSYSGTGATITGTTNSISITFATNATSGNLSVYGVNACGNGIISANYPIIVNPLPVAAGLITGSSTVCQGQVSVTYSIPAITNASSYFWTYSGTGATISGTTNTTTISFAGNATSGNLTVYGVNSCGNGIASANYAIVVNSLPVITSEPAAATVCTNGTTTFNVSATGTSTYQWRKNGINLTNAAPYSGVNTATLTITNPAKTENGATFDVVLNGTTCPVTSDSAVLTVYEKVVISSQPIASQIFCEGNTATITVTATGDGLVYQWYKGASALVDGGSISGVNSPTLTITPLVLSDGATYHCEVSGTSPCNPVISNNSILNVNQGPVIITPPAISQTICEGNSVNFSVGATVGSLSYQWYKGAVALSNGGNISGANTATLTISAVSLGDADPDYNCIVNNGCATETKSSELIVNPKPNAVATPAIQTICSSNTITTIALSGSVSGTTYNWTRNNTASVTGIAASGSGDISGSLTNTTNAPVTVTFTITPIANSCPGTPITATVLVNPTAQVNQPTAQVVCNAGLTSAVTFGTVNSGGTTSYSWTNNTASIGLAASGNGNIPAFTAINNGTTPIVATIIVTPTFNNGSVDCSGSTKTFTMTVNPTAQVNQPTPQVVCNADLTSAVTFATANSGGTTSYSWTNNTASIGLAASGNGNIPAFTAINTGTTPVVATIVVTPTFNNGSVDCSGSTKTFTITVNPTAQVNQPTPQVVCNAGLTSAVTFATANSGGTTSYSWTNNTASIGLAASGNGNIPAFTAINTGTTPIVATIVVTPTFNNGSVDCSGSTKTFTITVNPTAQVNQPTPQVVCNAGLTSAVTFATANSGGTTSYSWTNNTTSIGLAASGNGNIPAFTAINNGTTPIVATIVVTPTFNNGSINCIGTTKTFTITVNPTAQVNQPSSQVVCNAGLTSIVTFGTANSGGTTSYSWTNNTTSIGLAASGNGNIPAFTAINNGTTPVVATIVVTPTFNNGSIDCIGTTKTFTITVNPTPNTVATPATQTICSTNALTIGLSGNVAGTTFNWTRDNTGTVTGIAASGSENIVGSLTNTTNAAITVTFTITPTANGCPGTPINATVLVEAASVGGAVTISQPNVLPVEKTTTVCHKATGTLYLSGYTGTIVRWESSTTGGASWVPIANTNPTYQYPEILATTIYRAVIQNGPNCVAVFSTSSMINVIPNIKPSPVTATPSTICAGESSVLFSQSGYATSQYIEPGGDFGNSNPANWLADGCGNCLSAGNSNTNPGPFQLSATNGGTYSGINYTSNNKFAIANGNYNSVLETPLFNTLGLTNASLQFNHSFNLLAGAWATVELSVDGGNSYNIVLAQYNGPSTQQPYNLSTVINLDLNQYLGLSNLRVRFNYHGTVGSSWAIDDILIPDVPVNLTTEWVDASTNLVISTSATVTVTPAVTTTYAVTSRLNGCTSFGPEGTTYVTVTVNQKPVVTAADTTICSGTTSNVPLSSSETGTTFAWTVVQTNVSGASSGSGSTIAQTLTATGTVPGTAVYTITPTAKGCIGPTKTVTITVNPTAQVNQPIAQVVCNAASTTSVTFGTTNSGGTTTYSWTNNTTSIGLAASGNGNIPSFTAINNGTTPVVATIIVTPTFNNGSVNCTGPTKTFTITVNPTAQVNQPASQVVCNAAPTSVVTFGTTNLGGTTSYSWTNNTSSIGLAASGNGNIPAFTAINNGTSPIVATIIVTPTFNNGSVNCSGTTKTFTITVNPTAQVNQPAPQIVCNTAPISTITFGTTNSGGTTSYSWTNSTTSIGLAASGSGNIPSFTAINTGTTPIVATIIVTPTFNNGSVNCTGTTKTFTITVNPTAQVNQPSSQVVCNAGLTSIVTFGTANSGGTTSYSWTNNTASIGLAASGNGDIPSFTAINNGTTPVVATIIVTPTFNNGSVDCSGTTKTFTITVNPTAQVDQPSPQLFCEGSPTPAITFGTVNSGGTTSYSWTNDTTSIGLAAFGNGDIPSFTPINNGTTPIVAMIVVTPTFNNGSIDCNGTTKTFTITVNPTPTVSLTTATVCSGEPIIVPTTFSTLGTTFTWTVVQTNVTGASAGTGATIAHTLTAINGLSGTAVYSVTPTANGCVGTPQTVTINVNPKPTAVMGPIQTICYGGTATFSIALTGTPPWNLTYTDGTNPTTVTTSTNPYIFSVTNVTADKTYTLSSMGDAQCSASPTDITGSATVTVLNGIPGLWTGLVSTDWFDCLNWAGGLPSSTVNAVIGSLSLRMPVIDPANSPFAAAYGNIASAQDLIIASGASVTMASLSNSDLHISRNWINRGSFVPGIGTVTFNGATLDLVQTINAGIKTNETFYNLVTNNSNGAKGISVVNAFELTVSNTLSLLSGDLRLTGEAQLIQNGVNPNPTSGSGKLLIDQQGQKSSFNYNYWSSPVSTNGTNYSVSGVLRDGTDVTTTPFAPLLITFGNGGTFADGGLTIPISISNRWIHSYNSPTPELNTEWDDYYLWKRIGSTGVLKIGEGYIMKGTTGIIDFTSTQNYVFVGKPNSGTIPLFLPLEQTYLIGNPYPSALDADEFIRDNLKDCSGCRGTDNVFNGALYFWDQFGGGSHYLAEYVGGYAAYSLMSSVVAVADHPLGANNDSAGTKIPGRYIPVAQGFLIDAATDPDMVGTVTTVDGGTLNFKNSQRAFIRESSGNSVFMKTNSSSKKENSQEDTRPKIRLNLTATSGTNRQIVVGADSNTTNFFDIGYDAPMLEVEGNKIYWEINSGKFVIQAIPNFDMDQQIPLGLTLAKDEEITIKISSLENVPGTTEIYLYDNVTGMYHDIKNSDFKTTLFTGEYRNRFSLRFTGKTLSVNENNPNDGIIVLYSNNYKVLIIQNNIPDTTIENVGLYNLLGQAISNWNIENEEQTRIQIPIKNVSSGIYIVKLKTSNGDFSKKIIIK